METNNKTFVYHICGHTVLDGEHTRSGERSPGPPHRLGGVCLGGGAVRRGGRRVRSLHERRLAVHRALCLSLHSSVGQHCPLHGLQHRLRSSRPLWRRTSGYRLEWRRPRHTVWCNRLRLDNLRILQPSDTTAQMLQQSSSSLWVHWALTLHSIRR